MSHDARHLLVRAADGTATVYNMEPSAAAASSAADGDADAARVAELQENIDSLMSFYRAAAQVPARLGAPSLERLYVTGEAQLWADLRAAVGSTVRAQDTHRTL